MSQRLRYDDIWVEGEAYRIWVRADAKRYRLSVSRELLEDLSPQAPEVALEMFEYSILAAAQWKLDEYMAEPGDGVNWLRLGKRDADFVRRGAFDA